MCYDEYDDRAEYDDEDKYDDGPGPIDSYDAYAMGLRPARCNGCQFKELKHELGNRALVRNEQGWTAVYEQVEAGTVKAEVVDGKLVKFRASFMSIGHSDECWNYQPPKEN